MADRETSSSVSSIAGRLLRAGCPPWMPVGYWRDVSRVLGSALSQDETAAGVERARDVVAEAYPGSLNHEPKNG